MWQTLTDPILSLLYPQDCHICCGEVTSYKDGIACSSCWDSTRIFNGNETLCTKCGAFLFEGPSASQTFCQRCGKHSYDSARSIGMYEHALSASVLRLKRVPHVSRRLMRLLESAFDRMGVEEKFLIVPVPLSSKRLSERGFNQAALLGRIIARYAGLELDGNSLVRRVHTPMHRAGMDRKARAATVKNAFEVVRPNLIRNRNIVLVDDVFTSGETVSTCAATLKKNGAATVHVLTIARAA